MRRVRYERVRELLKRELGEIIRRQIPISEAGVVSVNDVGLAGDLQSAKVFVSIVGTTEQRTRGETLLRQNAGLIQGMLGQSVILRHTPRLRFVIDDSIARGNKVLEILDELEQQPPTS